MAASDYVTEAQALALRDATATALGKAEPRQVAGSTWPTAGQRATRRRDRGIDAVAEFGIPVAASVAAATTDVYSLGLATAVAAISTGGGELFLRRGVYRMGTRLFVKQGTTLRGEGPDATILYVTVTAFQGVVSDILVKDLTIMGDNAALRQVFSANASGGNKNWRFENVKFVNIGVRLHRYGVLDTNGAALTSGCGIDSDIEFDGCVFTGWTEDAMVFVGGVNRVSVDRCEFYGIGTDSNKGDNLKFSYGAAGGRVWGNYFHDGTRDAIDLYDAHSVDVIGNRMENMGVCAVESKWDTTGAHAVRRIRVHDNTAKNCMTTQGPTAPVFQLASPDTSASGNIVDGTPGAGFRVGGAMNNAAIPAARGIWTNNRATGCAGHGFTVNGVDGLIIQGNIAHGNTGSGFYVPSGPNLNVVGGAASQLSAGNGIADVWP